MKLSKVLPIFNITEKGTIISDTKATLTIACKISTPILFTRSEEDFKAMIEAKRNFIESLGDNILIHKQDFFYRELFSLQNTENDIENETNCDEEYNEILRNKKTQNFIDRSYRNHFNERPYLSSVSYIYISKLDGEKSVGISKKHANTDEKEYINTIRNSATLLEKVGFTFDFLSIDQLTSKGNPFSRYYNFQKDEIEELKDVDFSNNKTYVGGKEIKIFTIEGLDQFPTDSISYSKLYNGLPVSNMFAFSFPLSVPHVINQYIYVPNQGEVKADLDKRKVSMDGYNYKGSNDNALEELYVFKRKLEDLSCKAVYFHYNIMCFDANSDEIDKEINLAFSEVKFKKKVNSLTRKDLFLSGIPSNGSRLVFEKDKMMSLITDLEACAFLNYEQNYTNNLLGNNGTRLCDRLYGIPFNVDVFNKKINNIKNQNTIVLSGSGGGKSFTINSLMLTEYQHGAHIFFIDASFSYKIQCYMHGGVYLTFDEENKISFNPFYMSWLNDEKARLVFSSDMNNTSDKDILKYNDWLTDRINTLIGVIITMVKRDDEIVSRLEETIYRDLLYSYFKETCIKKEAELSKFDHFYDFVESNLSDILKKDDIEDEFKPSVFLKLIKDFKTGNSFGYLLNSMDEKVRNLEDQRFIVIDVSRIRSNQLLFSIVSLLAMDLYNQKVAKLPLDVRKILGFDEAWQAISSPKMANFMRGQVKVIRKYGGLMINISQELDDFLSSEIIKESIINNSAIKIFADMGEYKTKFDPIKKALSIPDSNVKKIKSLNMNNRLNALYKEICISWEQRAEVYALETPLELKAIFETDPEEVVKILPNIQNYGVELTAIDYADNERKKLN